MLGELCRLATVSRPDTCARLARIAAHVNSQQGRDFFRINDSAKTAKICARATALKCTSTSHPLTPARGDFDGRMRTRGEKNATRNNVPCRVVEFYKPSQKASPGIVGLEDCESLFTHLRNTEAITESTWPATSGERHEHWVTTNRAMFIDHLGRGIPRTVPPR